MQGTTGIVKITDFGVSGELEDDLEQKIKVTFVRAPQGLCLDWSLGAEVGTIHYMSPERVVGKPYQYNSDTCWLRWSLGLTLMECILMRYPCANGTKRIFEPQSVSRWARYSREED
ncbi:unnamed protein product [Durusdinium trenchii]|uniref:Dual specificity mitogen-activated protein kinase kinase 1 (MAP kinase kinase 1) (MAPKK 1) (ERK activator kinase 1) (MAPK/ERK kinase 1) (DdMEK1) (MEK1) (MAPK/ERK kinase A) (MEKA) n=2 Tax=Durusdinium trenchii TaxID=1381693 RepID=A0ABP0L3P0_9DINO